MSCLYPPVYLGATASLPSIIGLVPKALAGEQDKVLTGAGTWTATPIFTSLGINVATGVTPFCELEVDSTSTSSPRGIMSAQFSTGTDGARFHFRKARGTRAAPTTVVTGDNLGRLVGTGYDGSNYLEMASIYFATEGTIAATRVPTNIQFWTATDATPSVLTLALKINSAQQALFADGTAALPSIGFGSTTTTGFYSAAATTIGLASGGVAAATFTRDVAGGGLDITAQGTNTNLRLAAAGTGTTSLVANGSSVTVAGTTNGSITLTPSGSGAVVIPNGLYIWSASNNNTTQSLQLDDSSGKAILRGTTGGVQVRASSTSASDAFFTTGGHLLLGGLTTDGTGVLQFPAATTSAGGIAFGADVNIFRSSSSGQLTVSVGSSIKLNGLTLDASAGLQLIQNNAHATAGFVFRNNANADHATFNSAGFTFGSASTSTILASTNVDLILNPGSQANSVILNATSFAQTSGTAVAVKITPTYNQVSGTAANTDLLINRTQTAVGSGAQNFLDCQIAGVSKLLIDNGGGITNSTATATLSGFAQMIVNGNSLIVGCNTGSGTLSLRSGSNTNSVILNSDQSVNFVKTITTYNGIATAGNGVVSVQAAGRATAQTGANASVSTYTVGAADASFEVSANILVTTATTHAFTCTCAYTDEGNTARTITFTFSNVGGTLLTSIANTGGAVPYEGVPLHIRAKASTSITIATTGTFTSVTYNVEGSIRKIA